jgi:hypothetical protein
MWWKYGLKRSQFLLFQYWLWELFFKDCTTVASKMYTEWCLSICYCLVQNKTESKQPSGQIWVWQSPNISYYVQSADILGISTGFHNLWVMFSFELFVFVRPNAKFSTGKGSVNDEVSTHKECVKKRTNEYACQWRIALCVKNNWKKNRIFY